MIYFNTYGLKMALISDLLLYMCIVNVNGIHLWHYKCFGLEKHLGMISKLWFGVLKLCCEYSLVYMPMLYWVTFVITNRCDIVMMGLKQILKKLHEKTLPVTSFLVGILQTDIRITAHYHL